MTSSTRKLAFIRSPEGRTRRLEVTIMRVIVGMTGATGAPLGIRLLEHLARMPEVETHLVLSRWARTTIELETGMSVAAVGNVDECVTRAEDQWEEISAG